MRMLSAIGLAVGLSLPAAAQDFQAGFEAWQRGDYARAHREWLPLALGDARAQFSLGILYLQGKGVAQDDAQAAAWFRRAAEQGHPSAQTILGTMYKNGRGVARNDDEALRWWRQAAEQGNADAQGSLGVAYGEGKMLPRDLVQAYMWLSLSAAQGQKIATKALALATKQMSGADIDKARALARDWQAKRQAAATPAGGAVTARDARALLQRFLQPDADRLALTQALRPSSADYRAVYDEAFAAQLEARNRGLWESGPALAPKPGQTSLIVVFARTDELIDGGPVLAEFPGGYKDVVGHMKRGVPIVRFKFVEPGETLGMAFDGLVHVNGRWVLMPKPWRAQ